MALSADVVYRLAVDAGLSADRAVLATAIAWSESGLRPDNVGDRSLAGQPTDDGRTWGPSIGLWQVRSIEEERGTGAARDADALLDPAHSARAMAEISHGGEKFTPWTDYRNGKYLAHVQAVRDAVGLPAPSGPMTPADIIRAAMADLAAAGVPIRWEPGWEGRGWRSNPPFDPHGVVIHHTATRAYGQDYPSLGIVRDGHAALPYPPLAQFGLGRHTGTVYVIAAGKANHAGEGGWRGLSGNSSVWGIEAENDGVGEAWAGITLRNYKLLCAALARHTGFGADMVCAHREWSPYKIDPTGIDMPAFRADVAALLAGGGLPGPARPAFPLALLAQEDDMPTPFRRRPGDYEGKPCYDHEWVPANGQPLTDDLEWRVNVHVQLAELPNKGDTPRRQAQVTLYGPGVDSAPYTVGGGDTLEVQPHGYGPIAIVSDGPPLTCSWDRIVERSGG